MCWDKFKLSWRNMWKQKNNNWLSVFINVRNDFYAPKKWVNFFQINFSCWASINPINVENICASEDAASLQVFYFTFSILQKKVKVKFFSGLIATKLFLIDAEKVFFFYGSNFSKGRGLNKKEAKHWQNLFTCLFHYHASNLANIKGLRNYCFIKKI